MGNDSKEIRLINEELDRLYEELTTASPEPKSLDLTSDRIVIFSDQHRGIRNGADDFRRCERAYNAALAYYYHMGYTLVVLGDGEELWEERPGPVIETYRHTLKMEAKFHQDGRYLRVWGNHDDDWRFPDKVESYLGPVFGDRPLPVPEGYLFRVENRGERLGELLLVHGHQGSATSDRFAGLSKFFVRYLWRPFQRLTNYSINTPAKDWSLRATRDRGMQRWAASQPEPTVVICGHTHRPVFESQTHADQLARRLEAVRGKLETRPDNKDLQAEMSLLEAEIEWVRAQGHQEPGIEGSAARRKPHYFNTGCCSFLDGDVTGFELAEGAIRLVRWPDNNDRPAPQVLRSAPLREVYDVLREDDAAVEADAS